MKMAEWEISIGEGTIRARSAEGVPEALHAGAARVALAEAGAEMEGRVLDLCCGTGLVASACGSADSVVASDANLRHCRLAEEHAALNSRSVRVVHSDGFDQMGDEEFDEILFAPPPHAPATVVEKLIAQATARLSADGCLWLALGRKAGGKRYLRFARRIFEESMWGHEREGMQVWACAGKSAELALATEIAGRLARAERLKFGEALRGHSLEFETKLGLFAANSVDAGTRLLIDALPESGAGAVLDLGCGYGAIGITAKRLWPDARVTMCDVDRRALDCAERNVELNGCEGVDVVASDGLAEIEGRFEVVLSNIPTHIGRKRVWSLLEEVHEHLEPGGTLLAVISRELTVDAWAGEVFGDVEAVAESKGHRVFRCVR